MAQLNIDIGGGAEPLATQLKQQGVGFDAKVIAKIQRDHDAYVRLKTRALLSVGESQHIAKRILNTITTHLSSLN